MRRCIATVLTASLLAIPARSDAQQELVSWQPTATSRIARERITTLVFDYRGETLAIGAADGTVVLWDAVRGQSLASIRFGKPITALAFTRDDRFLAVGTQGAGAHLVDRVTQERRAIGPGGGTARAVALSPASDLVAISTPNREVLLLSIATGAEVGRLGGANEKEVRFLMFRGRGELLLTVGDDRRMTEWDVKSGQRRRQLVESEPFLLGVAGSPGADWLVLGTETTQLTGYRGGQGAVRSGGGAAYIDRIKIYNLESGIAEKIIENVLVEPRRLSLSADYKVLAVAERDTRRSTVGLWDVDRGTRVGEIPVPGKVSDVAFSPDGRWLSIGDEGGQLQLYTIKGVQPRLAYTGNLVGRKYVVTSPRAPLVAPSRRIRFAVLDLDDNGVGEQVANAIADQLANRLAANPGVRLVERRRMNALLREQDFQQSGRTDAATAVQMARVLNVQKVVMGAVARLGTTMTITAQLVDVETAAIDGIREVQCNNCALEELSEAVAQMSEILVAPGDALGALPDPPSIELAGATSVDSVAGDQYLLQGTITYSKSLEGVELVVNGEAMPASRALSIGGGKTTKLPGDRTQVSFVQNVPLARPNTVIAVRAVGTDGNDEQRYVVVTRTPSGRAVATRSPGLSLQEALDALAAGATTSKLATLAASTGIAFPLSPTNVAQLRALGANDVLLTAFRNARPPQ